MGRGTTKVYEVFEIIQKRHAIKLNRLLRKRSILLLKSKKMGGKTGNSEICYQPSAKPRNLRTIPMTKILDCELNFLFHNT